MTQLTKYGYGFLFDAMIRIAEAERDALLKAEGYLERERRHDRKNNPACWSNEELDRRIAEREALLDGEPF